MAAMRAAAEQAAENVIREAPAHAEQAVEVVQVVPTHAVVAADGDVRVVEESDPAEEVVTVPAVPAVPVGGLVEGVEQADTTKQGLSKISDDEVDDDDAFENTVVAVGEDDSGDDEDFKRITVSRITSVSGIGAPEVTDVDASEKGTKLKC